MAGTDTQHPIVLSLYVSTTTIVLLLVAVRVVQETTSVAASSERPRRTPVATPERPTGDETAARLAALAARRGGQSSD
jgi:hypothetical protein